MFKINDNVLYGMEGVCKIAEITEKNLGNKRMKYFVLKPIYKDNSTVFVPADNEALAAKMRRVLSEDEIYEIIRAIPDDEPIWIDDENTRKCVYKEILSNGDRRELSRLIKTLYLHRDEQEEKGKKLHLSDERFLKDAESTLYNEFALVLEMKPEQVLPFIKKQISLSEEQ